MAHYNYDRLNAEDNAFLVAEGPTTPMHVSAIEIFEAGPLRNEDGGIDVSAIRRAYEAVMHRVPRYRQKLAWIPFENRPVWIDDAHFQIDYHIRHVSLPRPGRVEDLKRVASRVMAHPLDRTKPLWEIWIVEGLEGDRFAIIAKTHHCMLDGAAGVELAQILLSPTPQIALAEPKPFVPRAAPTDYELLRDEIQWRAGLPLRILRNLRDLREETQDVAAEIGVRWRALREVMGATVSGASETPVNGTLSPHRRFDWLDMSLDDVRAVRKALGCTVNDVVLGTVTGAFRTFLQHRQVRPEDLVFRTGAPVSVRRDDERAQMGNRVSTWILDLPIGEANRLDQIESIHEHTVRLKESRQALGVEMMMQAMEWAPSQILSFGARMASGPINTIVTNVPGPQFPLYMLGAKLEAIVPQVPLLEGIGIGTALMSYNGRISWGFTADYELVPDLDDFVRLIGESFEELARCAGVEIEGLGEDASPGESGREEAAAGEA
jgi:diacylglycerol O-acyltransferase